MGLTIHYTLRLGPTKDLAVRRLLKRLHAAARDLPFERIKPLVEFDAARDLPPGDFPCGLFHANDSEPDRATLAERPLRSLIAFCVRPAPGAETAEFGLARYGRQRSWSWHAFCKTQYASNPRLGGVENFLCAHLGLIQLLDRAQQLGIAAKVTDEGGYWKTRDRDRLVHQVADYNQLRAGLGGEFKDARKGQATSPIFEYPNFEHFEARASTCRRNQR